MYLDKTMYISTFDMCMLACIHSSQSMYTHIYIHMRKDHWKSKKAHIYIYLRVCHTYIHTWSVAIHACSSYSFSKDLVCVTECGLINVWELCVCVCVCVCVCIYIYIHKCVYIYMHIYIYIVSLSLYFSLTLSLALSRSLCMRVCVCVFVYMYIYIYIYIYIVCVCVCVFVCNTSQGFNNNNVGSVCEKTKYLSTHSEHVQQLE